MKELLLDFRNNRDLKKYVPHFAKHPKDLKQLVQLIIDQEPYPFSEYGSWLLTHLVKSNPELLIPYRAQLIDTVLKSKNQSVLRNCVNVLRFLPLSEYKESEILDRLIFFVQNGENKVALQVISIYFLFDFIQKYPELTEELKAIVLLNKSERSAAYQAAIRQFTRMSTKHK